MTLPSGSTLETPLLVPSISSKGAGRRGPDQRPGSYEQIDVFEATLPALRRPIGLLVSSYDLHYGFIPPDRFRVDEATLPVDLLIVDSGSYETLPFDGDPPYVQDRRALPWGEWMFEATIQSLAQTTNLALVSFDLTGSYGAQIDAARTFFQKHPHALSDVLLKPPPSLDGTETFHDFGALVPHVADLDSFDVIGVTEKELDATPVGRLAKLAQLREILDQGGVEKPVHVFGGLDPLWTPLYYAAGAEVIDGLSWWRYAFDDGIAAYREVAVLGNEALLHEPLATGQALVRQANLEAIPQLADDLVAFLDTGGEWAHFARREILERTYNAMIEMERR